ncbi:hypothetical protein FRACYDRAFT_258839 [Fragilariopsis cylindrus CCMP1102]|uniref:Uncharacterized protein n=1 Tax=Fragilariopsis cylindrus CCMP1102 TaxID=635003 RepID=A0A1E7FUR1_9STRA|nr:hypothetical protein FRACYDRAFT_258839 [Fragilariopsis cylindrus CCMP1102]|eukprot:OEU21896.1 hypothetical protein FRACYDRAFT_258839 [Fragilariopsis cylindrus CCMP1102]
MRSSRTTAMPAATIARLTLSILVASLIVTPYDVRAFRSSASIAPKTIPITIGPVYVSITQTTSNDAIDFVNSDMTERKKKKKKKIKYDLGIGKNKAINNDNDSNNNDSNLSSSDEGLIDPNPTHFLVEHEAVRPYPSPTNSNSSNNNQNDKEKSNSSAKNNNKKLPIISHVRKSEDVLHIQDPTNNVGEYHYGDNNNLGDHPIIIPINNYHYLSSSSIGDAISNKSAEVVKFDLNTVWVEMMLHNEHKKLTSASN